MSGASAAAARTSSSGADRERALGERGLGRRGQLRLASRPGRAPAIAARAADPEARDRGVAPGLVRVGLEDAGGPRSGEVGGDLRIVRMEVGAVGDVGRRRVGKLVERQRPADDRDDVARLDPCLVVAPATAADARAADPKPIASTLPTAQPAPPAGPSAAPRSGLAVGRPGPNGEPVRKSRPGGRSPIAPSRSSNRSGTSNRAPRGKTRSSPRAVADPEADRPLVVDQVEEIRRRRSRRRER